MTMPQAGQPTITDGLLADGTKYRIALPSDWNGTLLLYSYGPPREPHESAWDADQPTVAALLRRGYAVAGCGTTVFWPLEQNLPHQLSVADLFERMAGRPERTIAWGQSIGGLMTASLVQYAPERLSGALVLCGTLGGGIGTHNQQLDCTFAFQTLLCADRGLELVRISDGPRNLHIALACLEEAQATAQGRARLALACAFGNVSGWVKPGTPAPGPDDHEAHQRGQFEWLRMIDWHVFLDARATLERRGKGNLSWNVGVSYRELLPRTASATRVAAIYDAAGLDLEADLDRLERAPRISPDPQAVEYFERYITFTGRLGGVPVLTLHSLGDGLVPVDHMHAYGDVVSFAGEEEGLRQAYLARAGHCIFSVAETLVCLDALNARIGTGRWPRTDAASLNAAAERYPEADRLLAPPMGSELPGTAGEWSRPAFVDFSPPEMPRIYDVRHRGGAPA